jgi:hypothetical protein
MVLLPTTTISDSTSRLTTLLGRVTSSPRSNTTRELRAEAGRRQVAAERRRRARRQAFSPPRTAAPDRGGSATDPAAKARRRAGARQPPDEEEAAPAGATGLACQRGCAAGLDVGTASPWCWAPTVAPGPLQQRILGRTQGRQASRRQQPRWAMEAPRRTLVAEERRERRASGREGRRRSPPGRRRTHARRTGCCC